MPTGTRGQVQYKAGEMVNNEVDLVQWLPTKKNSPALCFVSLSYAFRHPFLEVLTSPGTVYRVENERFLKRALIGVHHKLAIHKMTPCILRGHDQLPL